VPVQEDFIEQAAPYRSELLAHCYRLLGSVHEAEDLVQETYLRGWRAYESFEERAALRTWLYRIATRACLRALENRARRVLPARLGEGWTDPDAPLDDGANGHSWMEPLPDSLTPDEAVAARDTVRLAVATALQELPARQRAVLILREVARKRVTASRPRNHAVNGGISSAMSVRSSSVSAARSACSNAAQ
jgi:RNA polymerase sigma-70 factor (ECF subfamily)